MAFFQLGNLHFEWDDEKAEANLRRHRVGFREAATAFLDQFAEIIEDVEHSSEENRELLLGVSISRRLLLVVHVERSMRIRLISARTATGPERERYEEKRRLG